MKEGFGVGSSSWSVVSDSLAQYPEGPLHEMTEAKGQGVLESRQSPGSCWGPPAPPLKLVKTFLIKTNLLKCKEICRGNVTPLSIFTIILVCFYT